MYLIFFLLFLISNSQFSIPLVTAELSYLRASRVTSQKVGVNPLV
jgi:hypothetical protein